MAIITGIIKIKGERKVIDSSQYCVHPIFSPDGKKILYSTQDDGGYTTGIWLVNKDGSKNKRLTEPRPNDRDYTEDYCFTPNGDKILYKEHIFPQKEHLWIMDIDGENKKQLTFNETGDFDISPDGKKVVYTNSRFGGREPILTLNSMNINGTKKEVVIQILNASFIDCPKFHQDGKKIYFSIIISRTVERRRSSIETNQDFEFEGIWSININGSNFRKIIDEAGSHPVSPWTEIDISLNGKKIIHFGNCARHSMTLSVSNVDGSNTQQIKGLEGSIGRADINKDGTYVIYSGSLGFGINDEFKIYDVKTKSQRSLAVGSDPSFSPNGKEIVYTLDKEIYIITLDNPLTQIDINLIICIFAIIPIVFIIFFWIYIKIKTKKKRENDSKKQ